MSINLEFYVLLSNFIGDYLVHFSSPSGKIIRNVETINQKLNYFERCVL